MARPFYIPSVEKLRSLGYAHGPEVAPDIAAGLAEDEKHDERLRGAQQAWQNAWVQMVGDNAWRVIELPGPDDDNDLHLHDAHEEHGHILDVWVRLRSEIDFDRLLWQIGWSEHEPQEPAGA